MVIGRIMLPIICYVFMTLVVATASVKASEDLPADISSLITLHERQQSIDEIARHYLAFGHFWVVDFTLNDLNAATETVLHAAGVRDADTVFSTINKISSLSLYVPVLAQDILAVVRAKKLRLLLSHYSHLMEQVGAGIELIESEPGGDEEKLQKLRVLAESLSYEVVELRKKREALHYEIKMLSLYSLGYGAKLGLTVAPRISPAFSPARLLPFVSLFINSVWIGSELNNRRKINSAEEMMTGQLAKVTDLVKDLEPDFPLAARVMRMKKAFIEQNMSENSFSRKVNSMSLGYAAGDMAVVAKGVLTAVGVKVGLVAATVVTATGVGAAVLGASALLALGGRYLYKNRHSLACRWYSFRLDRKIQKTGAALADLNKETDGDRYLRLKSEHKLLMEQKETLSREYNNVLLAKKFSGVSAGDMTSFKKSLQHLSNNPGLLDVIRPYITECGRYGTMFVVEPVRSVFRFITTLQLEPEKACA